MIPKEKESIHEFKRRNLDEFVISINVNYLEDSFWYLSYELFENNCLVINGMNSSLDQIMDSISKSNNKNILILKNIQNIEKKVANDKLIEFQNKIKNSEYSKKMKILILNELGDFF